MLETTFKSVGIGVEPGPDDTKVIVIIDSDSNHIYRLPFGTLNEEILADLNMSNEDLIEKLKRELAKRQLAVPGQLGPNGEVPGLGDLRRGPMKGPQG
jgi:hypothetical protein